MLLVTLLCVHRICVHVSFRQRRGGEGGGKDWQRLSQGEHGHIEYAAAELRRRHGQTPGVVEGCVAAVAVAVASLRAKRH